MTNSSLFYDFYLQLQISLKEITISFIFQGTQKTAIQIFRYQCNDKGKHKHLHSL